MFANTLSNTVCINYNTQNANMLNYENFMYLFANTVLNIVYYNYNTQTANLLNYESYKYTSMYMYSNTLSKIVY